MPPSDSSTRRIKTVVADDHPVFREGLLRLLQAWPTIEIVAAADDGDEALALVRELRPDLLLLDLAMPKVSGLVALREVSGLELSMRTVLLTAAIEPADIVTALQLGARAVVLKESASDVLYKCIQAVMQGQYWLSRKPVPTLVAALREVAASERGATRKHFGLTPREREIIGAVLAGSSNSDIATKFSISEKTVKHHLTNIFDKVGVSTRLELALFALHHRLEPIPANERSGAP